MKRYSINSRDSSLLRQNAEERLKTKSQKISPALNESDTLKLIHELQVYQVELEMQNKELERAKEQIAQTAAQKYSELYDLAPTGYFTISKEGKISMLNLYGASLLGKERSNLKDSLFINFISDDTKQSFRHFLVNVFSSTNRESCEVTLIPHDKPPLVVFLTGLVTEEGKGSFVTAIDITERKQAEEDLKESEQKFRTVADFTYDWEAWQLPDNTYRYVSPSCERITGHTRDEFIADPNLLIRITHPDDKLKVIEHYRATSQEAQEKDIEFDFRILTPGGTIRWIGHSSTAVHGEGEKWLGRRESNRDITDRKLAEESLQASEKHSRELADSITDVFFEMDKDLHYIYWNEASENLLGIQSRAAIGKSFPEFFPDTFEIKKAVEIFKEVIRNQQFRSFENTFVNDTEKLFFEIRVYPTVKGIVVFASNITARKLAETEINHKNEQLQKTNSEKDKFFSIIAHDLRSPFNAFLGLTRMMEEELPTLSLDEIKTFAVSMRKSANMLFHLLENLLEWSRLQRGLGSFNPAPFLLSEEIAASIVMVQDAADKKKISIRQQIPDNMVVKADGQMFESLIRNLVFNAIKFTPMEGEITITAKTKPGNLIEISVSDTGIGMDNKVLDKLFRLDEQTHRKGTEGEPSTGLGLILCKDFIEKHGGTIWAESEVGKGSTFYFTLPYITDPEVLIPSNTSVNSDKGGNPSKNLTILIVEDDEISEMLIQKAVQMYYNKVISVRTGFEAIETCRSNPDIDLVLMDIQIPDINGYEATKLIRRFNKDVVIIAQTAYSSADDYTMAINSGCNEYITKPINLPALKKLIEKFFKPQQAENISDN